MNPITITLTRTQARYILGLTAKSMREVQDMPVTKENVMGLSSTRSLNNRIAKKLTDQLNS